MMKLTESLSYFTTSMWPRQPVHENPTLIKNLSRGKLKNVSLIDLPAFGSRLSVMNEFHTNAPNWPMEVNFAILNRHNRTDLGYGKLTCGVFK